jgi:hypothetical protein
MLHLRPDVASIHVAGTRGNVNGSDAIDVPPPMR